MRNIQLNNISSFIVGINTSRYELKENEEYYDNKSFLGDMEMLWSNSIDDNKPYNGDIIVNTISKKATLVSRENKNKILTLSFIKLNIDIRIVDKKYFIYMFNESTEIKVKLNNIAQSTTTSARLTVNNLKEIEFPIIEIEKQKIIGNAYFETLKLKYHLNEYSNKLSELTNVIIENELREGK